MNYRLKNKFAELFDNPSNVWTEEGIKTLPLFLQEMFEPISERIKLTHGTFVQDDSKDYDSVIKVCNEGNNYNPPEFTMAEIKKMEAALNNECFTEEEIREAMFGLFTPDSEDCIIEVLKSKK